MPLTHEQSQQLERLLRRYEQRVAKNRRTFKVEVHIPLGDLEALLALARGQLRLVLTHGRTVAAAPDMLAALLAVRDRDIDDPDGYDKAHALVCAALKRAGH